MPISTHGPEAAYSAKNNILLPKTDTRTAAAVQAVALQEAQDAHPTFTISAVTLPVKEA